MDKDLQKIKKLTLFMKKEGLLSLKHGDIELNLSPQALFHTEQTAAPAENNKQEETLSQFTPEQIMLWSAPNYVTEETEQN